MEPRTGTRTGIGRPWRLGVALVVAMALLAAGCGTAAKDEPADAAASATSSNDMVTPAGGAPVEGGQLVYGFAGESDGWNPTTSRWSSSGLTVANAIFDPLAAWDENFEAQPYLAQAFEHNDTYDVWTIELRPGVTFQDGTAVDAAATKKFLDAIRSSALTKATFRPIVETVVVDPLELEVRMSMPWSVFPASLTAQTGMLAAPSQLDDEANSTLKPVGSGPFRFDSWTPGLSLKVVKNTAYWRAGLPHLDAVEFKPIPEPSTLYNALRTGDLNMVTTNDRPTIAKLRSDAADGDLQYFQSRGETEETSVMLNTTKPPVNDVRLRRALAYATDTAAIARIGGVDPSDIAAGPFVSGTNWAYDSAYPSFDLDQAKRLVDEVQGSGPPITVTLQCGVATEVLQICQAIGANWEAAGLKVELSSVETAKLINNAISGDYEATIWNQFGAPDPDFDSVWWNGANAGGDGGLALNMARNQDPVLDAALYVGRTSHKAEERKLAYITVQEQMAKDIPYVWLSHATWVIAASPTVRGFAGATFPDGSRGANAVGGAERLTEVWFEN
jgi:ABC-type transport system substrate-binding protein